MIRSLSIFLLFYTLEMTSAVCHLKTSTWDEVWSNQNGEIRNISRITCHDTCIDDYTYELIELRVPRQILKDVLLLSIINSNFSSITYLTNPVKLIYKTSTVGSDFSGLALNFCAVKTIGADAFKDFNHLVELDLGFNHIEDLGFVSNLPESVKRLNLTNNDIKNLNFTLLVKSLNSIDLSFNKITFLAMFGVLWPNRFPVEQYLHLNNNNITQIELHPMQLSDNLEINLANNNIKVFQQNPDQSDMFTTEAKLRLLNLSQSLNELDIFDVPKSYFSPDILVVANNKLPTLDMYGDYFFQCKDVDFSNCSLDVIDSTAFRGKDFESLNFSRNNLKLLNGSLFAKSTIGRLDLSYNKIEDTSNIFEYAGIGYLNISSNSIFDLHSSSFQNIKRVYSLDLSFNKLNRLNNDSFIHCMRATILNLASNKITQIGALAFRDMRLLRTLNLENNLLTTLNFFSELPNLHSLDVRDNNLASIDFSNHSEYIKIKQLHLTLTGDLRKKSFQKLLFLEKLTFWNSKIEHIEKKAFQGLFNLEILELQNTTIAHLENGALDGLFAIKDLDAKNILKGKRTLNSFTFRNLRSIQKLSLTSIELETIMPSAFEGLYSLEELDLNDNKINFFHQNSSFSGLDNLIFLDLSHNDLTFLKRDDFKGLKGLKYLNLTDNKINDMELGVLQHFPHLESLSMARNNLTEFKVGAFSNLLHLKHLDIQQNSISTLKIESFLPLKSLENLNLEFNNLKTMGPLVPSLKFLKHVGMARNKWKCEYLANVLATFRHFNIDYSSDNFNFYEDNIDGIECVDICRYLFCLKDSEGISH